MLSLEFSFIYDWFSSNNYYLFKDVFRLLDSNDTLSTITINNNVMQYEPITISKYTDIFRFYYKYKPHGFQVFRALFEKAGDLPSLPGQKHSIPDLVTGRYQNTPCLPFL